MNDACKGTVEFYRNDGRWFMGITGPGWVLQDIAKELYQPDKRLRLEGATYMGSPGGIGCTHLLVSVDGIPTPPADSAFSEEESE